MAVWFLTLLVAIALLKWSAQGSASLNDMVDHVATGIVWVRDNQKFILADTHKRNLDKRRTTTTDSPNLCLVATVLAMLPQPCFSVQHCTGKSLVCHLPIKCFMPFYTHLGFWQYSQFKTFLRKKTRQQELLTAVVPAVVFLVSTRKDLWWGNQHLHHLF